MQNKGRELHTTIERQKSLIQNIRKDIERLDNLEHVEVTYETGYDVAALRFSTIRFNVKAQELRVHLHKFLKESTDDLEVAKKAYLDWLDQNNEF